MSSLAQSFGATGLATEGTLLSVDAHVNNIETAVESVDLKTPALGQAAMAASTPVVIASDQSAVPVSGPLTDAQLRASAVPVSAAALPLPTGAATEASLAAAAASLANIDANVATEATLAAMSAAVATEATLAAAAASLANIDTDVAKEVTLSAVSTRVGDLTETAPVSDTASSGLNGRLQRIAQRLTSLIALLPASLGQLASAASLSVVVANDQSAIATKAPVNTAGSASNTALAGTTASTATAPANAVGFILYADTDNTDTIRFAIGATASTTVGGRLEPGRDTGYLPCAANVSICATASGTNAFFIQWILSA